MANSNHSPGTAENPLNRSNPQATAAEIDDLGAEPLEGSGFENEDPEPEFEEAR